MSLDVATVGQVTRIVEKAVKRVKEYVDQRIAEALEAAVDTSANAEDEEREVDEIVAGGMGGEGIDAETAR